VKWEIIGYSWIFLIFAIILILPGLLFVAVGGALWNEEPAKGDPSTQEDESDDPQGAACMTFLFCVPMFWLPALV
jgi:hypothetical protein